MHELSMFWELAEILPGKGGSTETSAFIESFGIHLRNLIDFFYHRGNRDDVTAWDFIDATNTWDPEMPDTLKKAHGRVNKELTHLTQARIGGSPPRKEWDTVVLIKEIKAIAKKFAAKASHNKLHPKTLEFLHLPPDATVRWLPENVSHMNIASNAASTVTIVSPYRFDQQPFSYSEEKKPGKK
jgi:hypothetical protein